MNAKRIFVPVALVAAGGLTFAACSGSSTPSPTTQAPSTTQTPATSPSSSSTQTFLTDVASGANKENEPSLAQVVQSDPSTIVSAGQGFCTDMGNGATVSAEMAAGVSGLEQGDPSITANDANVQTAIIIVAAAKDLCPAYLSDVQAFASSATNTSATV